MNCSLTNVLALIATAVAMLGLAIGMALLAGYVWPLFLAAALVAVVTLVVIPALKNALQAYADCRGPSQVCSMTSAINSLGQAAAIVSAISFAVAGALQLTALAELASLVASWLGVATEVIVAALVLSGEIACGAAIVILLGVLTNALAYKSCMDKQQPASGPGPGGPAAGT